jgi:hypothetical protein
VSAPYVSGSNSGQRRTYHIASAGSSDARVLVVAQYLRRTLHRLCYQHYDGSASVSIESPQKTRSRKDRYSKEDGTTHPQASTNDLNFNKRATQSDHILRTTKVSSMSFCAATPINQPITYAPVLIPKTSTFSNTEGDMEDVPSLGEWDRPATRRSA